MKEHDVFGEIKRDLVWLKWSLLEREIKKMSQKGRQSTEPL